MESGLQTLIRLWDLDRRILAFKRDRNSLPVEEERRRTRLQEMRAASSHTCEQLQELQGRLKEIEETVASWRERIIKLERESYGARDESLLYAYKHQMQSLRGEIAERDDEGLVLLDQISSLEEQLAKQERLIAEEENVLESFRGKATEENTSLSARIEELEAQRAQLTDQATPSQLALYEQLLSASGRAPLAEVVDGVCQGCFTHLVLNDVARVRSGRIIVQCKSCQRILYTR